MKEEIIKQLKNISCNIYNLGNVPANGVEDSGFYQSNKLDDVIRNIEKYLEVTE